MFKHQGFSAVALVIILAVLALGGYAIWQKQAPSPVDTNIEPPVTSDWKTYKNDKYGFEFSYPSDWRVDEEFVRPYGIIMYAGDLLNTFALDIGPITSPDGKIVTLDEYLRVYSYDKNYEQRNKNVGNIQMLRFESKSNQDAKSVRYITVQENLKYEIVLNYTNENNVVSLEKLISTFRFTK